MQKRILRKICKRLSNSVFGKTIRNKRKQKKIRFAINERTRKRLDSSVSFNGVKFISGHLKIYDEAILQVVMDTLTYVSPSNLDLTRILLYNAVYGYTKPKWNKKF